MIRIMKPKATFGNVTDKDIEKAKDILSGRIIDIREMINDKEHGTERLSEYGLYMDIIVMHKEGVEEYTLCEYSKLGKEEILEDVTNILDGRYGDIEGIYLRYQLSWGGPGDEFLFDLESHVILYRYLDWFIGIIFDVSEVKELQELKEYLMEFVC